MQSLVRAGVRLPHDIAIVGYDDIDYAASAIVPLSTIRQPKRDLAREAVRLVLDEATDKAGHRHEHLQLPPELVVRESSQPA
ncbi:hypothetical protein GCM10025881_36640 [Pseudolysinimonas kribbensis]|uniref:Transcriptional regulator LacI/GalR-like sensor domain-containing protein n=2 Tax=Pseudolysinimonas kribbensis TaxID=433641 RepID=A0ABQ6K847_9MICO|nr:hypothetical protein GCM10025881_36640 [Pseudolysinimonas kribbensis]